MAPPLSKEIITDSDSSDLESPSSPEPAPQKTKSSVRKSTEKARSKKHNAKEAKRKPVPEPSSSSSDPETENESASSSEGEPSTPRMDSDVPKPVPAQEFKAPEGFKLMSTSTPRSSDVSKVFSDLRGKQIWHITAPASVPMNSIQELALDAVATGGSILTHQGVNYKLREDQIGAEKYKSLLLPDEKGNAYHRSHANVMQTFHLEQIVDLANGATHSEQSVRISELTKPKHEQPRHLKMRYKPIGSTEDQPETFGSSSDESEGHSFRMPQTLSQDHEGKKRRKSSMEIGSDNERGERRKKHKRIHSNSADGNTEIHSRNRDVNPSLKSKTSKNSGITQGRSEEQHVEKSSKKHRDETTQERKTRKEETRRKKLGLSS
ncbi:hypothetical protein RJZ56_004062 [Blastomyces dermatitidis]|uniref:DNA-directed RNA polymerase I subunit RPA34.5 n=1 Tax=Blastomyces gilchristii (strain SLH14081) TaxID=559298 RepID=A0A179U7K7_BLAGS|nr:uncharacterized protein BDBG_00471 [Blastomyces gilchristii SLH14081]OAT03790.1 hypothetical protein BDBG_00471 [Blastomyces gilchristii SLH14081]